MNGIFVNAPWITARFLQKYRNNLISKTAKNPTPPRKP